MDLIDILVKPKNSIVKQYKEIFKRNGVRYNINLFLYIIL